MFTCNEARTCSAICPLFRDGHECPTIETVASACAKLNITLLEALTLPVPARA